MENYNYPINSPFITIMTSAARKAARGIMRDFGEVDNLQISRKGAVNFVTQSDLRAEKIIREELQKARPKYGFLMEEGGTIEGEDASMRWVIDPIDGTTNFIHAVPYFCISVALEKITGDQSEIIAGIIYDPVHDEMFLAEKGKGAYVNQRRIRAANQRTGDYYFVTGTARLDTPYNIQSTNISRYAATQECVLRRSGSSALDFAYVAAGRYDAAWFAKLYQWDMAAGILLVKEAGGLLRSMDDDDHYYQKGCIFAGTEPAYQLLRKSMQQNSAA